MLRDSVDMVVPLLLLTYYVALLSWLSCRCNQWVNKLSKVSVSVAEAAKANVLWFLDANKLTIDRHTFDNSTRLATLHSYSNSGQEVQAQTREVVLCCGSRFSVAVTLAL